MGAKKVVDYLISASYRNIGMILGWPEQEQSKAYISGYRGAIEKHGLKYDESIIKFSYYKAAKTKEVISELIDKRVDAIFTISDYSALNVLDFIENTKLNIPDDIAVIGSGNTDFSRLIKMTSLDTRHQLLGETGAKLILEKIEGKKHKEFLLLEPDIVLRNTTRRI
jgi:DNA-binding LacI/PurR family transcriptional regulator